MIEFFLVELDVLAAQHVWLWLFVREMEAGLAGFGGFGADRVIGRLAAPAESAAISADFLEAGIANQVDGFLCQQGQGGGQEGQAGKCQARGQFAQIHGAFLLMVVINYGSWGSVFC